jgi:3-hydroxyacyl-[acyl-carrier-protein] dehydratase
LELFQGHYPEYPLMPGVLLCEAVFQAGALLIGEIMRGEEPEEQQGGGAVPVLTRILGRKFKREVRPGDLLEISATLVERMGPAWLLKGAVRVGGKVAVQVEFACARKGVEWIFSDLQEKRSCFWPGQQKIGGLRHRSGAGRGRGCR